MSITDWDLSAVHGLRQYMWSLLQTELGWLPADYEVTKDGQQVRLVPIVTPEQQPELNDLDEPYIVYAFSKKQSSNLYVLDGEIATFTIYSRQEVDIRRVLNLFDAKFDKRDDSAREINNWIKAQSGLDDRYKDFDYKTLWVSGAQGPQPVTEEGGRRDGLININITYTHYDTTPNVSTYGKSIRK